MNCASLFAGIGGFDLAYDAMGWQTKLYCEIDPFNLSVLKHHWPEAQAFTDITKSDFTKYANRIDILTGGFPCQPYSVSGKRLGKDDERHLWPHMLRAIREIKPRWVVGENVRGLVSWNGGLVFEEVQADLEAEGYQVQPFILPAAGVGAPHQRYRVWFVAHRDDTRAESNGRESKDEADRLFFAADTNKNRNGTQYRFCSRGPVSEKSISSTGFTSYANGFGLREENNRRREPRLTSQNSASDNWHNFPTQSPICAGDDGFPTHSLRQRVREDSMGLLAEEEIDKILSKAYTDWRKATIAAAGNAIVPQVALQIFKAIEQYELL